MRQKWSFFGPRFGEVKVLRSWQIWYLNIGHQMCCIQTLLYDFPLESSRKVLWCSWNALQIRPWTRVARKEAWLCKVFDFELLSITIRIALFGLFQQGRGTKSTDIKSTRERNQPRNEVNPGIKSTQEENQPEHEINQGGKEINRKKWYFLKIFHILPHFNYTYQLSSFYLRKKGTSRLSTFSVI